MSGPRVLLTGAFGSVGAHALAHCDRLGFDVHALDVDSEASRRHRARLEASHRFTTHLCDLRDADAVARAVEAARPEAILHVAAVIAPFAFVNPTLAEAVNVGGIRHLLAACDRLDDPPRFVFTSSYTVHGPRNPHRDLPPLDGDTPVAPADNYAQHKADGEALLADSALPWVVVRLPAVMATDPAWGTDPLFLKFFHLLSPNRREHLLDARDAGLALAHAVEADDVVGRAWDLGGPEVDCRVTGIGYHRAGMAAKGLWPMRETAFRLGHPDADDSWYGEDWVDTAPSQQRLKYQQHTLADHVDFQRHQSGATYWAMRALSPLIRMFMERGGPGADAPRPDPTPLWDHICRTFDLDPDARRSTLDGVAPG